jgi:hypothetical protein
MKTWHLMNIRGRRAEVIASINSAPDIPLEDKDWLIQRIERLPEKIEELRLDVHSQAVGDFSYSFNMSLQEAKSENPSLN